MPDFITLTCPTCGGKLKITDQISTFACGHCDNEHIVHREGGMVYLAPMAQDVRHIRTGVDKTAAELAVVRLTKEIKLLEDELSEVEKVQIGISLGEQEQVRFLATRAQNTRTFGIVFIIVSAIFFFAILNSTGQLMNAAIRGGFFLIIAGICFRMAWTLSEQAQDQEDVLKEQRKTRVEKATRPIKTTLRAKSDALERNRRLVES